MHLGTTCSEILKKFRQFKLIFILKLPCHFEYFITHLHLRLLMSVFSDVLLILGHPKTKAFVTHGGANGIYESIHHGIPMVGIPLFGEQHDNIAHMVAKGAALSVDFHTMSSADLLNALKAVINDPL